MKVITVALSTFLAAGFIQTALGLKCSTGCAACWTDNDTKGSDTKISCTKNHCGDTCPIGYHGMHCAKNYRCTCKSNLGSDCKNFGPCYCGGETVKGKSWCKPIKADGTCQTS